MDAEVISLIETYVAADFFTSEEILSIICDDVYAADELSHNAVEKIIEEKVKQKKDIENKWPKTTHNDLLNRCFKKLNKAGIITLHNVKSFAIGVDEATDIFQNQEKNKTKYLGFCFYQWQDTEVAINGGGLRLSYGDLDGDKEKTYQIGKLIFDEINKKFSKAIWNGDQEKKIFIPKFKWRKKTESEKCK